jgi:hypothetical protein
MPRNRANYRKNKALRKQKEREDGSPFGFKNYYGKVDMTHYNAEKIMDKHHTYEDIRY